MIEKIKTLLGIRDNSSDELLSMYLEIIKQRVMDYCNRRDLPSDMELIIVEMTAKYYKAQSGSSSSGAIESIKRGDTEIKYAAPNGQADDLITDYKSQLARWAKLRSL